MGPLDVECARAVRGVLAASLTKTNSGDPDDVAVLCQEAVAAHGEVAVLGFLAYLADGVSQQIAMSADGGPWDALARACRTRQALWAKRMPELEGPLPEFATLAHAVRNVSTQTLKAWSAAVYEQYGGWSIRAGIEIACQLLEKRGAQTGRTPLQSLQSYAVAEEGALPV